MTGYIQNAGTYEELKVKMLKMRRGYIFSQIAYMSSQSKLGLYINSEKQMNVGQTWQICVNIQGQPFEVFSNITHRLERMFDQ